MRVLFCCFAVALTAFAVGSVDRKLERRTYPVIGATSAEIHQSLEANGPKQAGRTFYGLTEFSMGYRYTPVSVAPNGGMCRAADVQVQIGITVTLPEWERPRGVDPDLWREWRRFHRALERHEEGHVRLADDAAERLRLGLLGLRGPCDTLGDRAKALADRLSEVSAGHHLDYDARTEHGVKEGAVWTFTPD
jgi:predicted secreted Zn-dependent protease